MATLSRGPNNNKHRDAVFPHQGCSSSLRSKMVSRVRVKELVPPPPTPPPPLLPSSDGTLMEQAADTVSVGGGGMVTQCSGSCLCLSQLNCRGSLFPQEAITCQASLMFLLLLERSTCSPLVILKSRKWEEVQCVHRFIPLYIYFRLPVEVRCLRASKAK